MAYHTTVVTDSSAEEQSESPPASPPETPGMSSPSPERTAEAQFYKLGDQFKLVLPDGTTHQGTVTYESVSDDAMHLTFRLTTVPR